MNEFPLSSEATDGSGPPQYSRFGLTVSHSEESTQGTLPLRIYSVEEFHMLLLRTNETHGGLGQSRNEDPVTLFLTSI